MTTPFDALGVAPDLVSALAARGITSAFAIQELMVADHKGMHKEQAEALCRTLPTNQIESCLRTWSRPHLWSQ